MTYDWDGQRTKRTQTLRMSTAIVVALVLPLAALAWSYVG